MNTLASHWDTFNAVVVPPGASETQRRETKRAFYAGAEAMRRFMLDVPDEEDAAMVQLDALQAEFEAFQKDVMEGRA